MLSLFHRASMQHLLDVIHPMSSHVSPILFLHADQSKVALTLVDFWPFPEKLTDPQPVKGAVERS